MAFGDGYSWHMDVFTNSGSKSCHLGGFMEVSSHRHDQFLTPFPALLPSLEVRGVS